MLASLRSSREGDIRLGWYREKLEWTKREVVNQELMGQEVEGSGVPPSPGLWSGLVPACSLKSTERKVGISDNQAYRGRGREGEHKGHCHC